MRHSAEFSGLLSGRKLKRLRRTCEGLLAELDLPATFTIPQLAQRLGARRGRPIHLTPVELREGSVYGLWIATDTVDVIAYESRTTRPHQDHIVAHELAHIICGHHGADAASGTGLQRLFPALDPAMVSGLMKRSAHSDREELEAESAASLMLTEAARQFVEPVWQAPPEAVGTLSRIEHSLGRPAPGAR